MPLPLSQTPRRGVLTTRSFVDTSTRSRASAGSDRYESKARSDWHVVGMMGCLALGRLSVRGAHSFGSKA